MPKGESMLIPSGPDAKMHLFAILLDPIKIDGYGSQPQVLLTSVVSIKPGIIWTTVAYCGQETIP